MALVCGPVRPELDGVAGYAVRLAEELRKLGVDVRFTSASTVREVLRAGRAVRRADVVHVQFAPSMYRFRRAIGLLPAVLPRGLPLVTTLHEYGWWSWLPRIPAMGWRIVERHRLGDRETGLLAPGSDRLVTTNAGHAATARQRFEGRVPVDVVPIGANVPRAPHADRGPARAAVRAELGLRPDARIVAFFGFVHPVKGVRYLAEAVALLRAEAHDLHLLVVGGFESLALPDAEARAFEAELRGQIADLGVTGHTTITGFREPAEVSRLLLAADVAALPFTAGVTTKSGSLLTAFAHGLPTVVTGLGPDEDLIDGETCVRVGVVRDGPALASGLRRLLDDPALARTVASGGERLAAGRSWRAIAERHRAIYESVLA